jgi:L-rhamnose isomerase
LQEFGDQAGPAGLMVGPQTRAVIAVEILVEQDIVAPVRVGLKFIYSAINRAASFAVLQKNASQAQGNQLADLPQRHLLS